MKKKGFTLIELIVVLAIISVCLGIGINRFSSIEKLRANNELNTLLNDMEYAKIKAVSTGSPYVLKFEMDSYTVKREGLEFAPKINRKLSYIKFVKFATSNQNNVIKFNPGGTVSFPGSIEIEVAAGTDDVLVKELVVRVGGGDVKIRKKD